MESKVWLMTLFFYFRKVNLLDTRNELSLEWAHFRPNADPSETNRGWLEETYSHVENETLVNWRSYVVCDMNDPTSHINHRDNWLRTPIVTLKAPKSQLTNNNDVDDDKGKQPFVTGMKRIYVHLIYSMRDCVGRTDEECKETFEVYYGLVGSRANSPKGNYSPLKFNPYKSGKGSAPRHISDEWILLDRIAAAPDQSPKSKASKSNYDEQSQQNNIIMSKRTLSFAFNASEWSGFHLAFHDTGACLSLLAVKIYTLYCPEGIRNGVWLQNTPTGSDLTSVISTRGSCLPHSTYLTHLPDLLGSSSMNIPNHKNSVTGTAKTNLFDTNYLCQSNGQWFNAQTNRVGNTVKDTLSPHQIAQAYYNQSCFCDPGYQPNFLAINTKKHESLSYASAARSMLDNWCQACPYNTYKHSHGNYECQPCPPNSESSRDNYINFPTVMCNCKAGFYRPASKFYADTACQTPPPPVTNLTVQHLDSSEIRLEWFDSTASIKQQNDGPAKMNSSSIKNNEDLSLLTEPHLFPVQYRVTCDVCPFNVEYVPDSENLNETSVKIRHLNPGTIYTFNVYSENVISSIAGLANHASLTMQTKFYLPILITDTRINKIGANFVQMDWRIDDNDGYPDNQTMGVRFQIYYELLITDAQQNAILNVQNNGVVFYKEVDTPLTTTELNGLKPDSRYKIKIRALTNDAFGAYSEPVIFKTLPSSSYVSNPESSVSNSFGKTDNNRENITNKDTDYVNDVENNAEAKQSQIGLIVARCFIVLISLLGIISLTAYLVKRRNKKCQGKSTSDCDSLEVKTGPEVMTPLFPPPILPPSAFNTLVASQQPYGHHILPFYNGLAPRNDYIIHAKHNENNTNTHVYEEERDSVYYGGMTNQKSNTVIDGNHMNYNRTDMSLNQEILSTNGEQKQCSRPYLTSAIPGQILPPYQQTSNPQENSYYMAASIQHNALPPLPIFPSHSHPFYGTDSTNHQMLNYNNRYYAVDNLDNQNSQPRISTYYSSLEDESMTLAAHLNNMAAHKRNSKYIHANQVIDPLTNQHHFIHFLGMEREITTATDERMSNFAAPMHNQMADFGAATSTLKPSLDSGFGSQHSEPTGQKLENLIDDQLNCHNLVTTNLDNKSINDDSKNYPYPNDNSCVNGLPPLNNFNTNNTNNNGKDDLNQCYIKYAFNNTNVSDSNQAVSRIDNINGFHNTNKDALAIFIDNKAKTNSIDISHTMIGKGKHYYRMFYGANRYIQDHHSKKSKNSQNSNFGTFEHHPRLRSGACNGANKSSLRRSSCLFVAPSFSRSANSRDSHTYEEPGVIQNMAILQSSSIQNYPGFGQMEAMFKQIDPQVDECRILSNSHVLLKKGTFLNVYRAIMCSNVESDANSNHSNMINPIKRMGNILSDLKSSTESNHQTISDKTSEQTNSKTTGTGLTNVCVKTFMINTLPPATGDKILKNLIKFVNKALTLQHIAKCLNNGTKQKETNKKCDNINLSQSEEQNYCKHLIRFVGVYQKNCFMPTLTHNFTIITEFCENGSLESFLKHNEYKLTLNQLLELCTGIAKGMEKLYEIIGPNFSHMKLTPWHVYVDRQMNSRIASINAFHDNNLKHIIKDRVGYKLTPQTGGAEPNNYKETIKIPLRYTAPECLVNILENNNSHFDHNNISNTQLFEDARYGNNQQMTSNPLKLFNQSSDVWSFGVICWDIFNYCTLKPYELLNGNGPASLEPKCLLTALYNQCYRLPPPMMCPEILHEIMMYCWHFDPNKRPTFSQLIKFLCGIRKRENHYIMDSPAYIKSINYDPVGASCFFGLEDWLNFLKLGRYAPLFEAFNVRKLEELLRITSHESMGEARGVERNRPLTPNHQLLNLMDSMGIINLAHKNKLYMGLETIRQSLEPLVMKNNPDMEYNQFLPVLASNWQTIISESMVVDSTASLKDTMLMRNKQMSKKSPVKNTKMKSSIKSGKIAKEKKTKSYNSHHENLIGLDSPPNVTSNNYITPESGCHINLTMSLNSSTESSNGTNFEAETIELSSSSNNNRLSNNTHKETDIFNGSTINTSSQAAMMVYPTVIQNNYHKNVCSPQKNSDVTKATQLFWPTSHDSHTPVNGYLV